MHYHAIVDVSICLVNNELIMIVQVHVEVTINSGISSWLFISPYLFLIATQFLNLHIKESPVKGISIAGTKLIISQLADDTALFLRDISQIPIALTSLQSFSMHLAFCLILINVSYSQLKNVLHPLFATFPSKIVSHI